MINKEIKYTYNDLTIVPKTTTDINSRKHCNPYLRDGYLPIFTAPMDSIVCDDNFDIWQDNKIIPIIPRNINLEHRLDYAYLGYWVSFSLNEFIDIFCKYNNTFFKNNKTENNLTFCPEIKVVIDIANGHMEKIFSAVKRARRISKSGQYKLVIMSGNIANPETYDKYCEAKIDYVRCGIGGGSMCLTSTNTGIHYPMASLINEIYERKKYIQSQHKFTTKIIADGSIKGYADAIKALALGADYVMIGGQFSKLLESAAPFTNVDTGVSYNPNEYCYIVTDEQNNTHTLQYTTDNFNLSNRLNWLKSECDKLNIKLYKSSHGMSTPEAQKNINPNAKVKVTEGKTINQVSDKSIVEWVNEFEAAFRSAMSYCNARKLADFIGNQNLIVNSISTLNTVNRC